MNYQYSIDVPENVPDGAAMVLALLAIAERLELLLELAEKALAEEALR